MINNEIYLAIAVMAFVNFFTRVFPFVFFSNKEPPKVITYIENYFPPVIMSILIVYSLENVNFTLFPYGLKEIVAILFTASMHLKFNNYLVSIFGGTIFYMFLVQYIS